MPDRTQVRIKPEKSGILKDDSMIPQMISSNIYGLNRVDNDRSPHFILKYGRKFLKSLKDNIREQNNNIQIGDNTDTNGKQL
jgi:hypothetical protein